MVGSGQYVDRFLDEPILSTVRYAFRLSDAYKELGDTAALNRDRLAAGIIGTAGAAALGAASSVGTAELAAVGIVGLGINEAAKYTNQTGAAESFYTASDEMSCLASTALAKASDPNAKNAKEVAIILEYVRRAELRLRTRLRRDVPDYNTVAGAFPINNSGATQINSRQPDLEALKTALEKCIPEEED